MPAYVIYHLRQSAGSSAEASLGARIASLWDGDHIELSGIWIVEAHGTSDEIRDALREFIPAQDGLLVLALGADGAWAGIGSTAGDWLVDRLSR